MTDSHTTLNKMVYTQFFITHLKPLLLLKKKIVIGYVFTNVKQDWSESLSSYLFALFCTSSGECFVMSLNTERVRNIENNSKDKLMISKTLLLLFMEKLLKIELKVSNTSRILFSKTRDKLQMTNLMSLMKFIIRRKIWKFYLLRAIKTFTLEIRLWKLKLINFVRNSNLLKINRMMKL